MYEIFEKLLEKHGVTAYKVSKETGIATATLTQWKNGTSVPKKDKLSLIANFFKVDVGVFNLDEYQNLCLDCGTPFNPDDPASAIRHTLKHNIWENAINNFGICWTHNVQENAKAIARNRIARGDLSLNERIEANIEIFRALFSRSIEAYDYDLRHVKFDDYVSMLLHQNQFREKIDRDSYNELVVKFGTKEGINEGETYYIIPDYSHQHTIAAHKEESWTSDELIRIEEYKQLLLAARNYKK